MGKNAAGNKADGTGAPGDAPGGVPGHGGDGAEVAEERTEVVSYATAIDVAKGPGWCAPGFRGAGRTAGGRRRGGWRAS
jgi:hypothetical protein